MTVLFDGRWRGNFGIGRYADELQTRLEPALVVGNSRIGPLSPLDPAYLRYRMLRSGAELFFTPGFNASAPGPFRQLLILHDLNHVRTQSPRSLKRAYMEMIVRPAIRRTGTVLTDSAFSRDEVAEWTGLDVKDVVVCGGGLNGAFNASPAWATPGELRSVLFVGNDKPHKNLVTVFAAMAMLPAVHLVCVGVDQELARPVAAEHDVGDRVTYRRQLSDSDLVALYRESDVLAFPSTYEGFGLPALEAMSQGKPVVFACDAVGEIVADATARLADPQDVEQLAFLLKRVVAEDSAARADARAARARTYTWEAVTDKVSNLIASL